MSFDFTPAAVPATVRTVEPNPFNDVVANLPVDPQPGTVGAAVEFTVPGPAIINGPGMNQTLARVYRQLNDAADKSKNPGLENNVTVRRSTKENKSDDGVVSTTVTIYAVSKIVRKNSAVENTPNTTDQSSNRDDTTPEPAADETPEPVKSATKTVKPRTRA
jgi:hypothetical protein